MNARLVARLAVWVISIAGVHDARAGTCDQTGFFYQTNHYVVQDIKLEAPFDIFQTVTRGIQMSHLPLQARRVQDGTVVEKGEFDNLAYTVTASAIGNQIYEQMGPNNRLDFVMVLPDLRACDDGQHVLEVVYRVYAFAIPAALAQRPDPQRPFLMKQTSLTNGGSLLHSIFPQLGIGYDSARHFYGGGHFVYEGKPGGFFNTLTLDGSGSSSSLLFLGNVKGSHSWKLGAIRHADWALGYTASDIPSTAFHLRQDKVQGRFSMNSRQLHDQTQVLYFGTAVEGGNQHASGPDVSPSVGLLSSQVGSLKDYVGMAWNAGRNSIQASYGLQAGKSTPGVHVDYIKHIVNAADSLRLLPKDHHPLTLDVQLGAGWITPLGPLPLTERFFGGNIISDFIPGDSWHIQNNPVIRSFSASGLNTTSTGNTGGTNFFSLNTTIAYSVWGQPLVPQSVRTELEQPLNGQMNFGEAALTDNYLGEMPAIQKLEADLLLHRPDFVSLRETVAAIQKIPGLSADLSDQISTVNDDLDGTDNETAVLDDKSSALNAVRTLVVSTSDESIQMLAVDVKALADRFGEAGMTSQQTDLATRGTALQSMRNDFLARFNGIDQTMAKAKAKNDLKYARSVLWEILHELNLYSVAPAILFDAARIGPQSGPSAPGTRFGVGPAVRLSLINFDVTLGYSFNPNPTQAERRGAFVMTLAISDLFR